MNDVALRDLRYSELIWLVPFVCIGLVASALFRPLPVFHRPAKGRVVVDAEGTPVEVSVPFRGAVLTWCTFTDAYLLATRAPETLLLSAHMDRTGFADSTMSWIHPEVLKNDSIWNPAVVYRGRGAHAEIETLYAYDAGAFLGNSLGSVPLLRRVGLPALYVSMHEKNWDEVCFSTARIDTALIGHPERGEALISSYRQAYADLARDLKPESLVQHPRVLIMGSSKGDTGWLYVKSERNSYQIYLPPAGVDNASIGFTGERPDAERILAMDPDIVFLVGRSDGKHPQQGPQEFMHDSRWLGLKAVQQRRVYRMPGFGPGGLAGLQLQPIWVRWMAEIAHPERLEPTLRQSLRDNFRQKFGYQISDEQIDFLLHVDENQGSAGYGRFMANSVVKIESPALK